MDWTALVIPARIASPDPGPAIRRPRLEQRLQAGLDRGLAVVVAGGGFGKTTLAAAFLHDRRIPHVWFAADSLDVSARVLFAHLTAGLAQLCGDLRLSGPGALTAPDAGGHAGRLLAAFLRDWQECGARLGRMPVLVLDDVHHLGGSANVRKAVGRLAAYVPRGAALILLGRRDPGLGLARLEQAGRLERLDAEDLAFTPAEARELIQLARARPVTETEARAACKNANGWALGLAHAARAGPAQGKSRSLRRYLAEEILGDEPPAVRRLLLAASLLRAIHPRAVSAVQAAVFGPDPGSAPARGEPAGQAAEPAPPIDPGATLRELADRQWYLRRLPGGESYRLHDLMAEFLRAHLTRRAGAEAVRRGHAAAAQLALGSGHPDEALAHALSARDLDLGVKLLRQAGPAGWEIGDPERWLVLLGQLRALGATSPWVDFAQGHIRWLAGEWDAAQAALSAAQAGFAAAGLAAEQGAVLARLTRISAFRADRPQTEGQSAAALAVLPPDAASDRALVHDSLALLAHQTGEAALARTHLEESLALFQRAGDRMGESGALNNLAGVYHLPRGDLFRALQYFERAYYLQIGPGGRPVQDLHRQYVNLANVGLLRTMLGQWGPAEAALHHAVTESRRHGLPRSESLALAFLGQLLTYMHRFEGARVALERALALQQDLREPLRTAGIYYGLAELHLEAGRPEAALAPAREDLRRVVELGSPLSQGESRLLLARVLVAAGRHAEAIREIETVNALEEQLARSGLASPLRRVQWGLARAGALGCSPAALPAPEAAAELAAALQVAQIHGYDAFFCNTRSSSADLLAAALRHGIEAEYVRALLATIRQPDPGSAAAIAARAGGRDPAPPMAAADGAPAAAPGPAAGLAAGAAGDAAVRPDLRGPRLDPAGAPQLEVRLLGDFEVAVGGTPLPPDTWPRERVRQLFWYLLLHQGRWVPVEALTEVLWPGLDPTAAARSFYVALHALRRVLEPSLQQGRRSRFIESRRGLCRLSPANRLELDVEAFQAACRHAEAAREAGHPDEAMAAWERAVTLYRGPLLSEDLRGDWLIPLRGALAQQYVGALVGLARGALATDRAAQALDAGQQALAADPCSEEACACAMAALAAQGRAAEAVRLYRQFLDRLRGELGVEPGPALAGLAARLAAEPSDREGLQRN